MADYVYVLYLQMHKAFHIKSCSQALYNVQHHYKVRSFKVLKFVINMLELKYDIYELFNKSREKTPVDKTPVDKILVKFARAPVGFVEGWTK